jgi:putative acetyltransferase
MRIEVDDLSGPAIRALLQEHIDEMYAISPPESVHALDLDALREPEITFWTVHDTDGLVGCGALKELDPVTGELKSMRTARTATRRGVAATLLAHIVEEARRRRYDRLYLETGAEDFFAPARALYARFGFERCEPFAGYTHDPNSVYLTKAIR